VPEMKLDVVDAAELAEMLQFLSQWLARDPGPRAQKEAASPPLTVPRTPLRYTTAPGFDKGTLARTLTGPCGQVASLPDRRQAYGSSPLVKSLHPIPAVQSAVDRTRPHKPPFSVARAPPPPRGSGSATQAPPTGDLRQ
jgi:hypothetical protein